MNIKIDCSRPQEGPKPTHIYIVTKRCGKVLRRTFFLRSTCSIKRTMTSRFQNRPGESFDKNIDTTDRPYECRWHCGEYFSVRTPRCRTCYRIMLAATTTYHIILVPLPRKKIDLGSKSRPRHTAVVSFEDPPPPQSYDS